MFSRGAAFCFHALLIVTLVYRVYATIHLRSSRSCDARLILTWSPQKSLIYAIIAHALSHTDCEATQGRGSASIIARDTLCNVFDHMDRLERTNTVWDLERSVERGGILWFEETKGLLVIAASQNLTVSDVLERYRSVVYYLTLHCSIPRCGLRHQSFRLQMSRTRLVPRYRFRFLGHLFLIG